jgi:hypothetical protein
MGAMHKWRFHTNREHTICVRHGRWGIRFKVEIDGERIDGVLTQEFDDYPVEFKFEVDGIPCHLTLRFFDRGSRCFLKVNGLSQNEPLPPWPDDEMLDPDERTLDDLS